jgi:hypothetical protein
MDLTKNTTQKTKKMSNMDLTKNTTQKTKKMSNMDPTKNTTQKTKKMSNTDPTNKKPNPGGDPRRPRWTSSYRLSQDIRKNLFGLFISLLPAVQSGM